MSFLDFLSILMERTQFFKKQFQDILKVKQQMDI